MAAINFFNRASNKIICVGRNYVQHCIELNNKIPTIPLLFIKPNSSLSFPSEPIYTAPNNAPVHHEVELAVLIGKQMSRVSEEEAMEGVDGYTIAIDVTDRVVQRQEAAAGNPWTFSKAADGFTPILDCVIPKNKINIDDTVIWLSVDGKVRQRSNINDMIFKIPYLLSFISQRFTLFPGDIILTGTPSGVDSLVDGNNVSIGVESKAMTAEEVAKYSTNFVVKKYLEN